VILYR